jgi:hypothetical protein
VERQALGAGHAHARRTFSLLVFGSNTPMMYLTPSVAGSSWPSHSPPSLSTQNQKEEQNEHGVRKMVTHGAGKAPLSPLRSSPTQLNPHSSTSTATGLNSGVTGGVLPGNACVRARSSTNQVAFNANRRLRDEDPTGTTSKSKSSVLAPAPAPAPAPARPGGGPAGKVASTGPGRAAPPSSPVSPTSTRNFRDLGGSKGTVVAPQRGRTYVMKPLPTKIKPQSRRARARFVHRKGENGAHVASTFLTTL